MATGKFYPTTKILWTGLTQDDDIQLTESIFNFDLLIFTVRTNVDLFTHVISPKSWTYNNNGSCTYLLQNCASINSTAWDYRSQIGVRPIGPMLLKITGSQNNVNWTAKLICVEGIKLG